MMMTTTKAAVVHPQIMMMIVILLVETADLSLVFSSPPVSSANIQRKNTQYSIDFNTFLL